MRCGQFSPHAQQRGQHGTGKDPIQMPVHVVFQTGIARRISADEVVERER